MQCKVDYFTYSKNLWGKQETPQRLNPKVFAAITRQHLPDYMPEPELWKIAKPKGVYVFAYDYDRHCRVSLGFDGIITVEHTGLGCLYLDERGLLYPLIAAQADHCSRIDVAMDILSQADPLDFVNMRTDKRTRSHEDKESQTGRTYVIGSKTSERHTKVYRYTHPHPRHEFLRIEYTYHRQDAKIMARLIDEYSLYGVAVSAGKRYGWTHPDYQPDLNATEYEIRAWRPERRGGKTVFWLHSQVIPAIVKTVKSKELDLEEFIHAVRQAAQA